MCVCHLACQGFLARQGSVLKSERCKWVQLEAVWPQNAGPASPCPSSCADLPDTAAAVVH